jgi:hypothetical protein
MMCLLPETSVTTVQWITITMKKIKEINDIKDNGKQQIFDNFSEGIDMQFTYNFQYI